MKLRQILIVLYLLFIIPCNGQDSSKKDSLNVSFITVVNFASSSDDTRKESQSGIGTIGLKFQHGYAYGSANFTVFSQNKEIQTDSLETKIFGTNLLLPENNSGNISNFSLLFGLKTFYLKRAKFKNDIFNLERFGADIAFKVNNTIWTKDDLSSPVTIATFNLNVNYLLLDAEVFDTKERIKLILSYGISTRRIGGDLGFKENVDKRISFLGTDKRGFNGTNLGVRLEISKFFGEMNLTTFDRGHIEGFSGNQAIINIGLIADLTLSAKNKFTDK